MHRKLHVLRDNLQNTLRHGGREQHTLTIFRKRGQNLRDLRKESHVEHAIRFVENENMNVIQFDRPLFQVINETARGRHDHVRLIAQHLLLKMHGRATDEHRGSKSDAASNLTNHFVGLDGQFAGWEHDEGPPFDLRQALNHWDGKGERFSGSGLRHANQILPLNGDWDGLRLDRRWGVVFVRIEDIKQFRGNPEAVKPLRNRRSVRHLPSLQEIGGFVNYG